MICRFVRHITWTRFRKLKLCGIQLALRVWEPYNIFNSYIYLLESNCAKMARIQWLIVKKFYDSIFLGAIKLDYRYFSIEKQSDLPPLTYTTTLAQTQIATKICRPKSEYTNIIIYPVNWQLNTHVIVIAVGDWISFGYI